MSYDNYNHTYRRTQINGPAQLKTNADIFTPTADQNHALGAEYWTNDGTGRAFRYCKNGAVALTRALMNASEAVAAEGVAIAQTGYTMAVGAKKFDMLLTTGNGYTDSELVDGWLWFNKSPTAATTVGDCYLIKDNKWTTSDTVMNVEIADAGGIRTAIVATDELSICKNPFRDTVVNPTSQAAMVVGVNLVDVTANYYYWAQFRGIAPLIVDASDTVVVGEPIGKAGTPGTAGAGGLIANDGTDCTWGTVVVVSAGAERLAHGK